MPAAATTDYNTDYDRKTVIYKDFRYTATSLVVWALVGCSGIITFTKPSPAVPRCLNTNYLVKIIFMVLLPQAKSVRIIVRLNDTSKRNERTNQLS